MGTCRNFPYQFGEEKKELIDYRTSGGGLQNAIVRIKSVEASLTVHDFSPSNYEIAIRGTSTTIATGAVASESKTAFKEALVLFDFIPDLGQTITVKNNAGDITYVKDVDYVLSVGGIIPTTSGAITNNSTIKVSYTKKASTSIEGLVNSGLDYKLVFEGLNDAQSGSPTIVSLHRVKFSPTSGLDLIGSDFGKIDLKASVLQNSAIVGSGLSQYLKIQLV